MGAQSLLAAYNITVEQAADWVVANINNPQQIFDVCKQIGITNSMLTEIVDYRFPSITVDQVKGYFSANHLVPSLLDSSGDATLSESVGQAVANEFLGAALHWQHDHNTYTADAISFALSGLESGSTHYSYLDFLTLDINPGSTSGFLTLAMYHEHTWRLSQQETIEFANALMASDFLEGAEAYQDAQDLQGYINYCDSSIGYYDNLVAQAPDYSSHWI